MDDSSMTSYSYLSSVSLTQVKVLVLISNIAYTPSYKSLVQIADKT